MNKYKDRFLKTPEPTAEGFRLNRLKHVTPDRVRGTISKKESVSKISFIEPKGSKKAFEEHSHSIPRPQRERSQKEFESFELTRDPTREDLGQRLDTLEFNPYKFEENLNTDRKLRKQYSGLKAPENPGQTAGLQRVNSIRAKSYERNGKAKRNEEDNAAQNLIQDWEYKRQLNNELIEKQQQLKRLNEEKHFQLRKQFADIRDELKESNRKLFNQINEFRQFTKNLEKYDGKKSAQETQLKYFRSLVKENPAVLSSALGQMIVDEYTTQLRQSDSQTSLLNTTHMMPIESIEADWRVVGDPSEKELLDGLLGMANNLQLSLSGQQMGLRKRIQDIIIQIYNLRNQRPQKFECDEIKLRLDTIAAEIGVNPMRLRKRLAKTQRGIKRRKRDSEEEQERELAMRKIK